MAQRAKARENTAQELADAGVSIDEPHLLVQHLAEVSCQYGMFIQNRVHEWRRARATAVRPLERSGIGETGQQAIGTALSSSVPVRLSPPSP